MHQPIENLTPGEAPKAPKPEIKKETPAAKPHFEIWRSKAIQDIFNVIKNLDHSDIVDVIKSGLSVYSGEEEKFDKVEENRDIKYRFAVGEIRRIARMCNERQMEELIKEAKKQIWV
jgi:hypothetical protein